MLNIAWLTLRSRWAAFGGTFLALALGVALMSSLGLVLVATTSGPDRGPGRFAEAPVVVRAHQDLTVPADWGTTYSLPLEEPRGLDPALVPKAAGAGKAVVDRSFYAQVADGPGSQVGHPWTSAAFGGYRLTAGTAPAADDQVVTPAGTAKPGDQVTVQTAQGQKRYTVSGTVGELPFEQPVFFTPAEAERISPRVDAVVVTGDAEAVRQAVGSAAEVLTGEERGEADPQYRDDSAALVGVSTMLGMAAGVGGFVSVFVVGSTFAFSVTQRRRELALFRVSGATPQQVRRLVLAEAAGVGAVAGAAGALAGLAAGPWFARKLAEEGLAPEWFRVEIGAASVVVLLLVALLGVLLALVGAGAAVLRAGRIRPIEALREATVETRAMTWFRWLGGLAALAVGIGLIAVAPLLPPLYWASLATSVGPALILAFALLSPVVIPLLARLATLPVAWTRGAGALLVRANTVTSVRRTAATAAPVLITVGLVCSLWSTSDSLEGAKATEAGQRVNSADYVVAPDHAPGLTRELLGKVSAIPGVQVAATTSTTVYTAPGADMFSGPGGEGAVVPYSAETVDPAALGTVLGLPGVKGDVRKLSDTTIAVDESWNRSVGEEVEVWLGDGTKTELTVVAVFKTSTSGNGAVLTPKHAGSNLPSAAYVKLRDGADPAAVRTALAAAVKGEAAHAVPVSQWTAVGDTKRQEDARLALYVIGGIAVVYTGVAVANTLVMSTRRRSREFALLRLTGTTPRQLVAIVAGEALLVVAVGALLAAGVVAVSLSGLWGALQQLVAGAVVEVPTAPFLITTGACAVVALGAVLVPAWLALRTPAVRLIGAAD
ncbi:FtsX-like permease family protein [Streptomyces sp. NPDC101118]|uniref:ABC transporter permease n=1 Tax=Streptomyces sp. NPDC101118 TaxID=3366109 RepID=UPI00381C9CC0